jgi:hypothetical protein
MTTLLTSTTSISADILSILTSGHDAQHPASGALHAIGGTLPIDEHLSPLNFSTYRGTRTKIVSNISRYRSYNMKLVPVLSDDFGYVHTYFPGDSGYPWVSWDSWVTNYVNQMVSAGFTDAWCIDIWNEPDLEQFWPRPFSQFCDLWTKAALKIKSLQPTWKVCGPSLSRYDNSLLTQFFAACQLAGVQPDVLSFHQLAIPFYALNEPWTFPANLTTTNNLAASYGISAKPFFLGEYVSSGLDIVRPGAAASWMVSMDFAGVGAVSGACHSTFPESDYDDPLLNTGDGIDNSNRDTLCGILSPENKPRAVWFLYKDYANMTGKMDSDLMASILVNVDVSKKEFNAIYCAKDSTYQKQLLTIQNFGTVFSPSRIMYTITKYQDSAWSKTTTLPLIEYGTIINNFNDFTIRLPPFAAGTEALHIKIVSR